MLYHGIVQWIFNDGDSGQEVNYSSFAIERTENTYTLTKIQFEREFQYAMEREFGEKVLIQHINIKTTRKVAHLN